MSKKIKSLKEISDDWKKWNKKNWNKFTKGFNDFFGIPNKKITATDHITKDTAIDITPEDIKDELKKKSNSALIERDPNNIALTPAAWEKFENNTMLSFDEMRQKINNLHQRNLNKIEDSIKIGKANVRIWLMKNEIKNADLKEQQKLAMKRFQDWSQENVSNVSKYFEEQKKEWQDQFVVWKKTAKDMPGKLKDNRMQMRKDYEEWIDNRRKRTLKKMKYKIEKSNFRMRLQWRRSLNSMVFFMPLIIVGIVVIILINAINQ
jgi:hypothetical protein